MWYPCTYLHEAVLVRKSLSSDPRWPPGSHFGGFREDVTTRKGTFLQINLIFGAWQVGNQFSGFGDFATTLKRTFFPQINFTFGAQLHIIQSRISSKTKSFCS